MLAKAAAAGKDGKYFAGFTRWTSFAVRKNPTKSWISADSRVEFMRFENVDDQPEPQDLKISWFMSNDKALAVPFPGHPEVSACQEPTLVKLPDAAVLYDAHRLWQPVLERKSDTGETWTSRAEYCAKMAERHCSIRFPPCPMYDVGGNTAGSGHYGVHPTTMAIPGI